MFRVNGIIIGLLEICSFLFISYYIRINNEQFVTIPLFSYFWFCITVLTGFWESVFIYNYDKVHDCAIDYIKNKKSTWTNEYTLDYVLPWKVSTIFYTEYAAHADREYLSKTNKWSKIIEGSHEWCCGLFSLLSLLAKYNNNSNLYYLCVGVSMGTQFMNSLLYISNYFIQMKDSNNPNYSSIDFPAGFLLCRRAFFWVNLCWLLFPVIILLTII